MKIKNITQVSFLALMLGMTGSLSSLSLAQAVEEAVKPKPTVTAEKSDNSVIKSEAKEPASASGYRPIALGKTIAVYRNEKGDIVESRHSGDSISLKSTDPLVAKEVFDNLRPSDVKKVNAVVQLSPATPEPVKQMLATYAQQNGLPSTTDAKGVTSISGKGSAAQKLVAYTAKIVPVSLLSRNTDLASGNTDTLSGSQSGNTTRTNTQTNTQTLSGSNSGNNTNLKLSSTRTDSGNSATSNNITGNTVSNTTTSNNGGNTVTLTNSGGNTTSTTTGGSISGNGNISFTGSNDTYSPLTINVTQLPPSYNYGSGYDYNYGGYRYNGGGNGYND